MSELVLDADVEVNSKTFEIVLKTKAKDYQLKAATIEDARSWADAITAAITAKTITEC
eukprot:gene30177-39375_t